MHYYNNRGNRDLLYARRTVYLHAPAIIIVEWKKKTTKNQQKYASLSHRVASRQPSSGTNQCRIKIIHAVGRSRTKYKIFIENVPARQRMEYLQWQAMSTQPKNTTAKSVPKTLIVAILCGIFKSIKNHIDYLHRISDSKLTIIFVQYTLYLSVCNDQLVLDL